MSVTGWLLHNRHAVWALVVATVVLGLVAYRQIPVRLFPDTAPPLVNVVTSWPGATATDVEREVTEPLETAFAALEGVAGTRGTSQDNVSTLAVEFHYGTDVRMAAVDVDNAVSRLGSELPADAERPRVLTFSTADRPISTLGVRADDLMVARRLAEDVVGPRLQALDGVAAVDVFGGRVPTVLVDVDPAAAEAHRVSLPQIAAAIRTGNVSAPAGRVRTAERETMLRVDRRAERVEDLGSRVIGLPDGGQLRLDSLAEIHRGAAEDDAWFSIDGERAIAVQVYRSEDANTVAVAAAVTEAIAALEAELPELTIVQGEESASFTEQSVGNLLGNVWQALLLASVILFLFLGRVRAALVTAFSMPLAFGLTFAAMWLLGMEFNLVTLSAVILAVGMVVDASVVVLENIVRLRDAGHSPLEAARAGADEVRLPVLAGVATTVVVLLPLLSLPGFVGRVFGPLATTLLIAFTSSVVVALVVVPILSLQIRPSSGGVAASISRPFQAGMDRLRDAYMRLLEVGLRHRAIVLALALLSFGIGVAGLRGAGMNLLPRMDGGTFTIALETPSGSSLGRTTRVIQGVEAILADQPEVVLVQSQAGFEPGMKLAGGSGVMGATQGFISVTLSPRNERDRSIWEVEDDVRERMGDLPDLAHAVVKEVGNTAKPTTAAPLIARIQGPDPLVLDVLGDEVLARLEAVPSVVQPSRVWRRDMERVLIDVDERQAALLGQSPLSVARHLAAGAEGIDAGTWSSDFATPEPIEVRFARSGRTDVGAHLAWPLHLGASGELVPARALADPVTTVEQGLFTSEDLGPVLDVQAQVDDSPLSFAVADAQEALDAMVPPEGYSISIEGENSDLIESRVSILRALAVSVLAVYLLLVAQFRSWVHPLTVMMAVPLSLVGVSAALWLAGKAVSMPVMVGLVLLVGTVVNNSILLVDVIRVRRDEGADRRDAIREGVASRFRPIMMTSLSTVIGMTPLALELALGAERFSPLATAVIGGLLASTLLTMVVIPVLYDVADSLTPRGLAGVAATAVLMTLAMAPSTGHALTLEEAWSLVQEQPAAEAADLRVQASQQGLHAARSRVLPTVELQARTAVRDPFEPAVIELPIPLPDGSSPNPIQLGEGFDQVHALSATLTQPVFAGGALAQGRKAAVAAEAAARATQEDRRGQLWLELVRAWYGAEVAADRAEITAEVAAAARAREASLERLVAQGRAVELELSAVALRRAEAEQVAAEARVQATVARRGLAALLGRDVPPIQDDVVAAARALITRPTPSGSAWSVAAAEAQAQAAEARGKAATGAALPSVALRASAQYANPDTSQFPVRAEWGSYWDVAAVLTWKLDGGVAWREASRARLEGQAARAGAEATARRAEVEREEALGALELASTRLDLAAERVTVAERARDAAERAHLAGRGTDLDVLDRTADLAQARAAELATALETIGQAETVRTRSGRYGP